MYHHHETILTFNENESHQPYLGNKKEKAIAVSQSDAHFVFVRCFLHTQPGAKIKLRTPRIVRHKLNLARPEIRKVFQANLKRV